MQEEERGVVEEVDPVREGREQKEVDPVREGQEQREAGREGRGQREATPAREAEAVVQEVVETLVKDVVPKIPVRS